MYPYWYEVISHYSVICISMTGNDIEHVFMGTVTICISSLEKGQLKTFAH